MTDKRNITETDMAVAHLVSASRLLRDLIAKDSTIEAQTALDHIGAALRDFPSDTKSDLRGRSKPRDGAASSDATEH